MLRIFYTAGPGNAFETFRKWKNAERDLTNSHVSYSGQMLEACARHGAAALITCSHDGAEDHHGDIRIVHRADLSRGKSGLAYHLSLRAKAQRNIRDALDFGANVVVISEDSNPAHYSALRRRGIRVVQSIHTRLYLGERPGRLMQRLRLKAFGKAYAKGETIVLSASDVITAQVTALAMGKMPPLIEFLPLYFPEHYAGIAPPQRSGDRLEVLFIGRIEENKGVIDLVAIADQLRASGINLRFQICGDGGALPAMKQRVVELGLSDSFLFHGWCDRNQLRAVMADCQLTIVPTRSDFIEGFNQVIIESILAGRPVVASDICPAVNYVGDAAQIVAADDLDGYVKALTYLAQNPEALALRTSACAEAGSRFLDPRYGFGAALDEVFTACAAKRLPQSRKIDPKAG